MGRWILAAAALVASSGADADEVVIRGPELSFTCPSLPSWHAVEACVTQRGWTIKELHAVDRAKLVEINAPANRLEAAHAQVPSIAIYVQQADKHWQLGGLYEVGTEIQYEVLDFQPLAIAHTHGFRLDIGTRQPTTAISPDGITMRPEVLMMHHVLLCNGASYECTELVASCDAFVDGKLVSSFHGQIAIGDRQVRADGDGSFAAPACNGPQQLELAWQ